MAKIIQLVVRYGDVFGLDEKGALLQLDLPTDGSRPEWMFVCDSPDTEE